MRYCFDLDGVICEHREDGEYQYAKPDHEMIEVVQRLHRAGHEITIDTARGSVTGRGWHDVTASQLDKWGVPYDHLRVGEKPYADVYVDDKAVRPGELIEEERVL